jgi:hypothetical protein
VQRLTISAHFRGEATQPAGEPPQVDVKSRSESIQASAADGTAPRFDSLTYKTHVTFTGETTFTETGTISAGTEDELDIATVGEGTLAPSAESGLMHGSVIWRITQGRARFEGASGLITSNFVLAPETGEVDERQVAVVFLP